MTSDILEELQDNIHSRVFQSLTTYIDRAGRRLTSLSATPDLPSSLAHSLASVPAACLVTGVNMPDRDATFDSLVGLLRASITPHVARLQSKECSTLRAAMYRMISQLIGGGGWASLEDEEEEVMVAGPKVKRRQCTMAVLSVWYKEQVSTGEEDSGYTRSPTKATHSPRKTPYLSSPRKKPFPGSPVKRALPGSPSKSDRDPKGFEGSPRKKIKSSIISQLPKRSSKPPLVVVLEDLESFHPRVLSDLVLICSEYRQTVPIVLVFGVATTPDKVHQSLSHNASACLAMEVFRAEPSTQYLTRIIEKVLMSNKLPFHLGGRPFKLLLDIFLYNDLSVENFIKGLKVCMLEHFIGHASSFLCCPAAKRPARLRSITSSQLDSVRKLPSFRTFVEAAPPKEQAALLLDHSHTKEVIVSLLDKLEVWYARFCVLVKVVSALTNRLPGAPMGRQVREVLAVCLSQPLVETEEYKEVEKGIRNMAREELCTILQNVLDVLKEHHGEDEVLSEMLNEVSLLVGRLSSLDQAQEEEEASADGGGGAVTLGPSDRFRLREVWFDNEALCSTVV
ncbi:Origin recognition complex subunit 3 [Portunus trituberculatus]|uniref:Origin recognition complex subunit 3 n=1 Tax=Portunus trituberculatus TaxID=210409 RepID=A0A5B7CIQ0_PORTR|nr:Origin recognition complex subunit 3 [Portunus trituberculatus]